MAVKTGNQSKCAIASMLAIMLAWKQNLYTLLSGCPIKIRASSGIDVPAGWNAIWMDGLVACGQEQIRPLTLLLDCVCFNHPN